MNKKRGWTGIVVLISIMIVLSVQAAPVITAKDGILYQDGKPCFLTGVFCYYVYEYIMSPHSASYGTAESVPGKKGQGLRFNFEKLAKPTFRSVYLSAPDTAGWVEKGYKTLMFWVKGDGSDKTIGITVENYGLDQAGKWKTLAGAELGKFSLKDTQWNKVAFPLERSYPVLKQANTFRCCLLSSNRCDAFSWCIDEMTAVDEHGREDVLFDFEEPLNSRTWSGWNKRNNFKDDPVYKAVWDDPLYREVSGRTFQIVGMNTYHLMNRGNYIPDLMPADGYPPESAAYLCKKLDGLPMVPGFTFVWGFQDSAKNADAYAKKNDLPLTMIMKDPGGHTVGGYNTICPEDPYGGKVFREMWQREARHLLKSGANIYAYELVNENSGYHDDACQFNIALFMERLEQKYGDDINKLNEDWGTNYRNFGAVQAQIPELGGGRSKIKGLSVEWNKFMEDRYVEMLRQGGEWIHQVEDELGKPHALMAQMGMATVDFMGFRGTDTYKLAKGLDCLMVESGVKFGPGEFSGTWDQFTNYLFIQGYRHQLALDLADAASQGKVILNTEHHWDRYGKTGRLVSRKSDVITSLWIEFLRGVSAVYTYAWEVVYASREEALATASTGNSQLLSPHVFPRESLNGYKEIQDELARVADVVMARPRLGRNAQVAVLFSRPTARFLVGVQGWDPAAKQKENVPFEWSHQYFYDYLIENHYPMRYFYEEQLVDNPEEIKKYKVVLIPHSDNVYPETVKRLRAYVEGGGMLVCFGDALLYDEYGNERYGAEASALLGMEIKKREKAEDEAELKDFGVVRTLCKREMTIGKAMVLSAFSKSAAPFITVNEVGKGKVFHVNADAFDLTGKGLVPAMNFLMGQMGIESPVEITGPGEKGGREPKIEAHVIDRGDSKVVFLVNWVPDDTRVVKLKLKGLAPRQDYYLADVAGDRLYTCKGHDRIKGEALGQGINLVLPGEERVVLLVSLKKYKSGNAPADLLDDAAATALRAGLEKEQQQTATKEMAKEARIGKIEFAVRGGVDLAVMEKRIKETGGNKLETVELTRNDYTYHVREYGMREGERAVYGYRLLFREGATADEKQEIMDRIMLALAEDYGAQFICKAGKGLSENGLLRLQHRKPEGVCVPLDINGQANMGFADEKADDQKGGLFDEGRSLKELPVGSNTFAGIVFDIIDPAGNNGKSCIVLKGQAKPFFPGKVEEIKVGRKIRAVHVLHTASYCSPEQKEPVYRIRLNYADGKSRLLDVQNGRDIKDWMAGRDGLFSPGDLRTGWRGAMTGPGAGTVSVYAARLANPDPDKEIITLDIISADGRAVPAIFSITVEENEK